MEDYFGASRALTVIEEIEVELAVTAATETYPQAEDMFNALVWRLARDPECGANIDESGKRIIKLPSIKGVGNPVLTATYTFTDQEVTIDWVKFYPYDEKGAVSPPAYIFK